MLTLLRAAEPRGRVLRADSSTAGDPLARAARRSGESERCLSEPQASEFASDPSAERRTPRGSAARSQGV